MQVKAGWFHVKTRRKKVIVKKIIFLWKTIKDYRVIRWFLLFLASFFVFGTTLGFSFFFNFQKFTVFLKCILISFLKFVIVGLNKFNIYLRYSELFWFLGLFVVFKFCWAHFWHFLFIFRYFNISKLPYISKTLPIFKI